MPVLAIRGRRLNYAVRGDASARPLLLLHGLGDDASTWIRQRNNLAERFYVVAPDLPGQGESQVPEELAGYVVEAQAAAMVALLDALELERPHIAGHALGGLVALAIALNYPERLAGLILESTSPEPLPDELRERMRRALAGHQSAQRQPATGADQAGQGRTVAAGEFEAGAQAAAWALVAFDGFVPRLESISAPTLVIAGESDGAFVQRGAELLHGWIPFSRLVRIANAAHVPHNENPAAFAAEVTAFLREVETT